MLLLDNFYRTLRLISCYIDAYLSTNYSTTPPQPPGIDLPALPDGPPTLADVIAARFYQAKSG